MSIRNKIENYSLRELIHSLEREHPGRDCTMSQCVSCDNGARGLHCSSCLTSEIARRVGRDLAAELEYKLAVRADINRTIYRLEQQMKFWRPQNEQRLPAPNLVLRPHDDMGG